MKRAQPQSCEIIRKLLDAGLVTHRRMSIGTASMWFRWIFPLIPVHMIKLLCLSIVGFHILVTDRPGRRNTALMVNLAEVLFAQAKQGGAVKLGIAADVVVGVGVQLFAILVVPDFLCLVFSLKIDGAGAPVIFFSGNVAAPL